MDTSAQSRFHCCSGNVDAPGIQSISGNPKQYNSHTNAWGFAPATVATPDGDSMQTSVDWQLLAGMRFLHPPDWAYRLWDGFRREGQSPPPYRAPANRSDLLVRNTLYP
jgi:hypothetical protein